MIKSLYDISLFPKRIKEMRNRRGWSQEDLAYICDFTQAYISKLENGHRQPTGEVLIRLADALQCSTDFLLGADMSLREFKWMTGLRHSVMTKSNGKYKRAK